MPHLIEDNAECYGVIGITFAILTWLIVVGFCVVVVAVISAELGGAASLRQLATSPQADAEPASRTSPTGRDEADRGTSR